MTLTMLAILFRAALALHAHVMTEPSSIRHALNALMLLSCREVTVNAWVRLRTQILNYWWGALHTRG